jgi:ketosteroid isomerase-like protein
VLSRSEIKNLLTKWNQAWNRHDFDGVMQLFHKDVLFENWTGAKARGRDNLEKAWAGWFENHGGFCFTEEDTFIDEAEQKVLYRWQLDWPTIESGFEGKHETRRGVDVLHFKDGKIISKLTYCKTTIEIEGQRIPLSPKVYPPEAG